MNNIIVRNKIYIGEILLLIFHSKIINALRIKL